MNGMMILISAFILIACVLAVLYGLPLVIRWMQVHRWGKVSGKLALTYDDGPDEVTTAAVLDLLDELGVQATFYLVGFRGEKCPTMLERLKTSGHQLGTHTHMHKNAWKKPIWFEYRDAMRAYETLGSAVDARYSYRPPFGKVTALTMIGMWLKGRRVEWWTVAANDTRDSFDDPEVVAKKMLDDGESVVLMHCHHVEEHRRAFVLGLTRALIEQSRGCGVELVMMRDLCTKGDEPC